MTLGQRIKELREEKGMTQEELGKLVNVSKASFSKYEANAIEPNTITIIFLANFFNVSLDYLYGRTNYRKPILSKEDFEASLLSSEFAEKYAPLTAEQKKTLNSLVEVWEKEKDEKK